MNRKPFTIGVLGGMGTYATIHLFRQYAQLFPAEKEWERPRLIIDNRCTMPSRVRAALYGENREELILLMSDSIRGLLRSGCDRILLDCNTAHLFIPDIFDRVPDARGKLINIIDICADGLCDDAIKEVFLLASEGVIDSGIYQETLCTRGIHCKAPKKEEYRLLRDCIEAVKRNRYTDDIAAVFSELIHRNRTCILGCTELPILYEKYGNICTGIKVYDPIYMALTQICREFQEGGWG